MLPKVGNYLLRKELMMKNNKNDEKYDNKIPKTNGHNKIF